MINTPLDSAVSTNIMAKLKAYPIDNNQATDGEEDELTSDIYYLYTTSVNDDK